MTFRPVAMNSHYKHGDDFCAGCCASGETQTLQRATCTRCGAPNCALCATGRSEHDPRGLCLTCGKGKAPAEYGPNVEWCYVDEPPAWQVRQWERERGLFAADQSSRPEP